MNTTEQFYYHAGLSEPAAILTVMVRGCESSGMLMETWVLPEETTTGKLRRFTLTVTSEAGEPSWWLTWI